jgi:UDP-N-acetylmuramoyl-tripeptide--D-alanyl-D-alanine ligase
MIPLSLGEIAAIVGGTVVGGTVTGGTVTGGTAEGDGAVTVTAPAVLDGRQAEPGALFVAFAGEHVDGHDYAVQAGLAGAVAVLGSRPTPLPTVVVEDVQAALQVLAAHVVARLRDELAVPALTVAGLTGSQGKTSTKDLLAAVLSSTAPTTATIGSLNNELGVPLTMLRAGAATRFLALEMGARHIGDIAALTSLVAPDIAVVLNVGQAHLGEFGSRLAIAQAKGELVRGLAPGGTAVLNADDPRVVAMRSLTDGPVLTFGHAEHADVRVLDLALDRLGRPSFTLRTATASARVALPLVGAHQALNASAAAAAGLAAGVPLDMAAAALATASLSKWRMELRDLAGGATLLNDSYNANPDSTRAALDALAAIEGRRRIAVLGEMRELGDDSEAEHRAVGKYAASRADVVAAVGEVVLVKASRGAHLDEVAAALALVWRGVGRRVRGPLSGFAGYAAQERRRARPALQRLALPIPAHHRDHAGRHEIQAGEETHDVVQRVDVDLRGGIGGGEVVPLSGVPGSDGDDQVAARGQRPGERGRHPAGRPGVGEVQHPGHDHAGRLGQVDQPGQPVIAEDPCGVAHVARHGDHSGAPGEQAAGVRDHHRVVVHVGHPGLRVSVPGDVVRVQRGRQAGPDVDELPDAAARHVADGPAEELPVLPGHLCRERVDRQHLLRQLPVGREVLLAAQPVIPHPGDVRPGRVERLHRQFPPFVARPIMLHAAQQARHRRHDGRRLVTAHHVLPRRANFLARSWPMLIIA